jgi:hypothetical protein
MKSFDSERIWHDEENLLSEFPDKFIDEAIASTSRQINISF